MDLKKRSETTHKGDLKATPQLRVRTSLRGGESLDACQKNLAYWRDQYYRWYEQARDKLS